MNNETYKTTLDMYEKALKELRAQGITIATGIIGENLTKDDLFFCASLDRCLRLIDGMVPMLKDRNLTCAGALLRLQMDNCMRTYAAFIAADKPKVIDCIISGDPINKEKDTTGQKMSDGHLKDEISKIDSRFAQVYDQASGFIHLSSKAFYQTVAEIGDDNRIAFQIGHPLPEKRNEPLLECADAFVHFVKLHYKMLDAVVESKKRFDAEHQDHEESSEKGAGDAKEI